MKIRNRILTLSASLTLAMPMLSIVSCGNNQESKHGLIYNLTFDDEGNLGKNSVQNEYEDATKSGSVTINGQWKEHNTIKLDSNAYFTLPSKLLSNKENVTISLWTKEFNNDEGDVFSFSDGNSSMSLSLHGNNLQWNAFDLELKDSDGQSTHLLTPQGDPKARGVSPEVGCIQSTIGAWQLVTITFNQYGITIYHNGKKIREISGDYSFSNKNINQFVLGKDISSTSATSFEGHIANLKIYDKVMSEEEIADEYKLSYKDFLTTDFEFNDDSTVDSKRQLIGVKGGQADTITDSTTGKEVLDLKAEEGSLVEKPTSWLDLPTETFFGHNELTISADLYIRQARPNARLFSAGSYTDIKAEGTSELNRYFDIYAGYGFNHEDGCRMKLESVENSSEAVLPVYLRQAVHNDTSWYPTKEWFNVTYTIKPKGAVMYINGKPVCINDDFIYNPGNLWNYDVENEFSCVLGRTYGFEKYSLDAMIDDFKMYSVSLTPKEVAEQNGVQVIQDDNEAVQDAVERFALPKLGDTQIFMHSFNEQGVELVCQSNNLDVVDAKGNVYPSDNDQSCSFTITASRGKATKTFTKTYDFAKTIKPSLVMDGVGLDHAKYDMNSRYYKAMDYNADDMFLYDPDRFLVNYQKIAGIKPKYEKGYGGWIRQHRGGEGQFETFYIGTLARLTQSMPDYVSTSPYTDYNTPAARCRYMLEKIKECQDNFAKIYPNDAGYLGAIPLECFDALVHGVRRGQIPGSEWINWVPWYMYHKNLRMCYDVYTFYVGPNDEDTQFVKDMAYQMLKKASLWVYNKTKDYNERQHFDILIEEYGGIAEALYLAYDLVRQNEPNDVESAHKIFTAARFFQETDLLIGSYEGTKNVYTPRHVNSTIPKYLACCAEYQVTGDKFYLQAAKNFFDWMDQRMSYPDGGLGVIEFYENEDELTQEYEANETCCCYNMLRLADYLFKFTGEAKYAHYFEKVFYNHIMGAINTENVDLGQGEQINAGKVYSTPTAFGYHKIYSNQRAPEGDETWENGGAFWCCCCSGQETFAKLTYGNAYIGNNKHLYINMYNPISLQDDNGSPMITLSGDVNENNNSDIHLKIESSYCLGQMIQLIKPWWCEEEKMTFKIDGQEKDLDYYHGYYSLNVGRDIQIGETLEISFEKEYKFVAQKGFETKQHEGSTYYSNCLFYGPTMLVANLGEIAAEKANLGNYFKYVYNTKPKSYEDWQGPISQYNKIDTTIDDPFAKFTKSGSYDHILTTKDNGSITFTPFMNIKYEYYSMYMYYCFNTSI